MDHRLRCQATALILPAGAAVGLLSAAELWGVPLGATDAVSVLVPGAARMRSSSLVQAHRTALAPDDVTELFGVPVTMPVRTAFDLARTLPRVEAVIALDAFTKRRKVHLDAVRSYLDDHVGWPGMVAAREVVSQTDPLAESQMETRMRLVLVDGGLPPPVSQFRIFAGRRMLARVDFAYPEHRLALEYDGDHHRDRTTFRFDMERQNELHLAGWRVLRFNADDVLRFPDRLLAAVRASLARS
ncbi:DUF559 domain-containing protein [Hamadaea tsunoensis]|uniref:DUF559 domain-containing protein n=1 Tax=Hamadaea tsunoensis TaxID=53368 RepID=UPI001FE1E6F7|nr:DUF559 domain-containing protein [Hamadaea tsunoensis]